MCSKLPHKIKRLTLGEISEVDNPAQEQALATIMKAKHGDKAVAIAKAYIGERDRNAKSFRECFEAAAKEKAYWEAQEELYPALSAFDNSIRTIAGDENLTPDQKQSRATESAMDFLTTLRELLPEVEDELMKAVEKASKAAGDQPVSTEVSMTDKTDQVAELESKLADLEKSLEVEKSAREEAETVAKMSDAEKAYMGGLSDDEKEKFRKMKPEDRASAMKVAKASDESVTVEGETVYKSAVGDATFALYRRLEAVEKSAAADREAATLVRLEKRAGDEFANLPGEPVKLAKALGAIEGLGAEVRETIEGVFKAAEAQFATVTKSIGHNNGQVNKGAEAKLDAAAAEIRKSDPSLTQEQAIAKALDANPELYEG